MVHSCLISLCVLFLSSLLSSSPIEIPSSMESMNSVTSPFRFRFSIQSIQSLKSLQRINGNEVTRYLVVHQVGYRDFCPASGEDREEIPVFTGFRIVLINLRLEGSVRDIFITAVHETEVERNDRACLNNPYVLAPLDGPLIRRGIQYCVFPAVKSSVKSILVKKFKQGMEEDEILMILKQILMGLQLLHQRDIIHLEVALSHVYVLDNGEIKLGFGPSTIILDKDEERDYSARTCVWAAPPEVNPQNRSILTKKVDIWAIGIIGLEMWYGVFEVIESDGINEILAQLLTQVRRPLKRPKNSEVFKKLLQSCLDPNPVNRPSVNQILGLPIFEEVKIDRTFLKRYT